MAGSPSTIALPDAAPCQPLSVAAGSPIRVQLSRRKGWRKPENTIVCSRPGRWGNPFRVGDDVPGLKGTPMDAEDAVQAFEVLCVPHLPIHELRGKNLACWCRLGTPCHVDALLRLANSD